MPQVIQFTNQMFDYGIERFFPEKVHVVRATTLDSRFMTSHGRFCIIADDGDFVTHVGIEVMKSALFFVEHKLGWDFTYYQDPLLEKSEEKDGNDSGAENDERTDKTENSEGKSEGEVKEDNDSSLEETGGESDAPGSTGDGESGTQESGRPTGEDDAGHEIVTVSDDPEEAGESLELASDEITAKVDDDDDDDLPFSEDKPEPAPETKSTQKKGGRRGKKDKK